MAGRLPGHFALHHNVTISILHGQMKTGRPHRDARHAVASIVVDVDHAVDDIHVERINPDGCNIHSNRNIIVLANRNRTEPIINVDDVVIDPINDATMHGRGRQTGVGTICVECRNGNVQFQHDVISPVVAGMNNPAPT